MNFTIGHPQYKVLLPEAKGDAVAFTGFLRQRHTFENRYRGHGADLLCQGCCDGLTAEVCQGGGVHSRVDLTVGSVCFERDRKLGSCGAGQASIRARFIAIQSFICGEIQGHPGPSGVNFSTDRSV